MLKFRLSWLMFKLRLLNVLCFFLINNPINVKDVLKKTVEVKKQFGFVPVYAQLCGRLELNDMDVLTAYTFTVLENQVLAAVKTVPLGQMAGQRILWHLHGLVPQAVEKALKLNDEQLSSALPRYAMLSMKHETQYSRLFRS